MIKKGFGISVGRFRVALLATLLLLIGMVQTTYASSNAVKASLYVQDGYLSAYAADVNTATQVNILSYSENILRFDNTTYTKLEAYKKREWMETALKAVKSSQLGTQTKYKVFNFIAEQDSSLSSLARKLNKNISADAFTAWGWIEPAVPYINIALGVLVGITMIWLSVSTLLDIMLIGDIGVVTLFVLKASDRKIAKSNGQSDGKPWFISRVAWDAHNKSESSSKAIMSYILGSFWRWLVIFLILTIMITGRMFDILLFIGDMFN